uniref:Superoxide dismutase [Cu-Zn] n=1 Tax=Corethrella appendiculata TaxID=1370023 RepID=U5EZ17_9DIPT
MNYFGLSFVICVGFGLVAAGGQEQKPIKAVAVIGLGRAQGNVTLTQSACNEPCHIEISLVGLTPNQKHGFHIHDKGDLSGGCLSTAGHYNPDKMSHGAPNAQIRHVGDLGNIQADANGECHTIISDSLVSLFGSRSVIGRGVVVHAGEDDLGLTDHPDSLTTGNAGARIGCGVIGIAESIAELPVCNSASSTTYNLLISIALILLAKLFH